MTKAQLFPLIVLCTLVIPIGCADKNKSAPARVTGTIKYNGKSVMAGSLNFHPADGSPYPGLIGPDGTYNATDLPVGEMVVTIETESANPDKKSEEKGRAVAEKSRLEKMGSQKRPAGAGPTPGERYVKIPEKYADKKTSPLKVTLSRGGQTHHFDLTD